MRRLSSLHVLGISAVIVTLGGCSGAGQTSPIPNSIQQTVTHASAPELTIRNAHGPLVYISDSLGKFIDVFHRNGTLAGRIATGLSYPVELYVDARHNLWVADQGLGEVLKFRRGSMKASVYHDAGNAWAPTTCSDGTLYVADFGSITVFAHGRHYPTGSLSDKWGAMFSVACDATGNIFAAATVESPPGYVVEFPSGSNQAKLLPLYLPNPIDVKPDPAGNLLILDSAGGSYNTVAEYTEAGAPTGKSMPTDANWMEMAISPNGKEVFGADVNDLEGSLRAFPSGNQLQTYVDGKFRQLGGIAYDPG
jgi:hypothetical protein